MRSSGRESRWQDADRAVAHGRAMNTKQPTMTMTRPTSQSLPEEMLERFRARAGDLDRENAYFAEDLA